MKSVARQLAQHAPFERGVAVICGSVAWGGAHSRSDIDVACFQTEQLKNVQPDIQAISTTLLENENIQGFRIPRVDIILVGSESETSVTRDNLVTGSVPITETQTLREYFASNGLRFYDHIGSLAALKGEPWSTFHARYLQDVNRTKALRTEDARRYASSFVEAWRSAPPDTLGSGYEMGMSDMQVDVMSFAEKFPIHLMRQVLALRGRYPRPDRRNDVLGAFAQLRGKPMKGLMSSLMPLVEVGPKYDQLLAEVDAEPNEATLSDYSARFFYPDLCGDPDRRRGGSGVDCLVNRPCTKPRPDAAWRERPM